MKQLQYTIIDTAGQWTPILEGNFTAEEKAEIGKDLLAKYPLAGQVAFINRAESKPIIEMMGGELSINGTIAGKYYLKNYSEPRQFSVSFPSTIVKQVLNNEVILSGIKYRLIPKKAVSLSRARSYCADDVACGFIIEKKPGEIIPIIYVNATDTLISETACGSASLSYALLTNRYQITQPSGKIITITNGDDSYTFTLECAVVPRNEEK